MQIKQKAESKRQKLVRKTYSTRALGQKLDHEIHHEWRAKKENEVKAKERKSWKATIEYNKDWNKER